MTAGPASDYPLDEALRQTLLHTDLQTEYYKIVDLVTSFDQRLLTIKGWGVTFSLATTALAFQQNHYGLFLVAAASSLAFWIVEGSVKIHQMRYYPRMGDIEAAAFDLYREVRPEGPVSSPLIDWSWYTARSRIHGGKQRGFSHTPEKWKEVRDGRYRSPLLFPHVAFPHVIVFVFGMTFFLLGLFRILGPL